MLITFYTAGLLLRRRRTTGDPHPQDQAVEGLADAPAPVEEFAPHGLRHIYLEPLRDRDRTRLMLMLAIFCFAGTWAALRTLTSPYGIDVLGLSPGAAGGIALPGSVGFLLAAAPIAYLSDRIDQLRMITYGIALFAAGLLAGFKSYQLTPSASVPLRSAETGYPHSWKASKRACAAGCTVTAGPGRMGPPTPDGAGLGVEIGAWSRT
jgi:hypothetical protein